MMTSGDISGMFAAQNQAFSGQRQFAQQISPMGLSGYGSFFGGPPGMPTQFQGMTGPASFNYGNQGMMGGGYAPGNRFAGGVMSGMGGMASLAGTGLAVGSLFGKMGAIAPMVDPFVAGMAGWGAGSNMGLGMMGRAGMAMGAAALPLTLAAGASMAVGSFIGGGQQQMAINNTLGQNFNHFNPMARGGQGFTRQDSQQIGDQIRSLSHIPEMMTSVSELTSMLPKLKASGVMQGVKDAQEFSSRFKEAVNTIKETARVLGTSMEDASSFFQHSRGVGFLGKSDQLKNALNVQLTSGLTGMSHGQVMQLQAQGADLATSMGGRRSVGASAVTSIAQNIGLAQQQGMISEGLLEDITGLQGQDAVQAGAGRMAHLMSRMAGGTSAGRLVMAGMAKFDERGRAVGLDEDLVRQFNSGGISIGELKRRAGNLTDAQKMSFSARQADLSMSFAGQVGPGGMGRFVNELVGGRHGQEGANLLMQRYGASAADADLMSEMQRVGVDGEFSQMSKIRSREADIRERTDPEAILRRVKTKMHGATLGKLEQLGANVSTALGKAFDDFIDDLVGRHVTQLSEGGARAFQQAMAGGNSNALKSIFDSKGTQMSIGDIHSGGLAKGDFFKGGMEFTNSAERQAYRVMQMSGSTSGNVRDRSRAMDSGSLYAGVGVSGAQREMLYRMKAGIDDFGSMSAEDKLSSANGAMRRGLIAASSDVSGSFFGGTLSDDASAEEIERFLSKNTGGSASSRALLQTALQARKAGGGGSLSLHTMMAIQGGNKGRFSDVSVTEAGQVDMADQLMNIEARQNALKDARSGLTSDFSEATASVIAGGGAGRAVIKEALSGGKNSAAIREALDHKDPGKVAGELAKLGIKVSPKDVDGIRAAYNEVTSKGGKDTLKHIGTYEAAERASDRQGIVDAARDLGADVAGSLDAIRAAGGDNSILQKVQSASDALSGLGDSSKGDFKDRFGAVTGSIGELAQLVMNEKDPAKRDAIIKASGRLGGALRTAERGRNLRAGGSYSQKGIADTFNLDANDSQVQQVLAGAGVGAGGRTQLNAEQISQITKGLTGLRAGSDVVKAGQPNIAMTHEQQLISTLKTIDSNSMKTATILAMIAKKDGVDSGEVDKLMNEQGQPNKDGSPSTGGKKQ